MHELARFVFLVALPCGMEFVLVDDYGRAGGDDHRFASSKKAPIKQMSELDR